MKKSLLLLAILPFMIACQERFNATDEQSFKTSREKIEKNLDQDQKTNLEKAMRVVALESMRLKWEEPEKYKEKSFNEISLKMIDGLSYSSVIELAEDILKNRNKKEIQNLTKEIDSLNFQKTAVLKAEKSLNLFRISALRINKKDFFDKMVPELEIEYQYIGKNKLVGAKTIHFEVRIKSTDQVVQSVIIVTGDDESILEKDEIITENLLLSQTKDTNPKLWSAQEYPIESPNLSDYDLALKASVLGLTIDGKKVEIPKINTAQMDTEIKNKKEKIDELKSLKGSLDELELTDQ